MLKGIENQRGVSIIEVLVAIGVMTIVMASVTSFQVSQQRETRALSEKLAALDGEKLLISALMDGSTCLHILNNPAPMTFNSTTLSPMTPQYITPSLPLYAKVQSGTPGPVVAEVGKLLSASSPSLVVTSVRLRVNSGSGNTYLGAWEVAFDNSKTIRALKPISISTILTVDNSVPTASKITSCMSNGPRFTNHTYHAFCATPVGGTLIKSNLPNRVCTLSATDDDVGNTVVATDYKCRVGNDGTNWRGYAPLGCGMVACLAHCFDIQ